MHSCKCSKYCRLLMLWWSWTGQAHDASHAGSCKSCCGQEHRSEKKRNLSHQLILNYFYYCQLNSRQNLVSWLVWTKTKPKNVLFTPIWFQWFWIPWSIFIFIQCVHLMHSIHFFILNFHYNLKCWHHLGYKGGKLENQFNFNNLLDWK